MRCRCGSGAHPRRCDVHPDAFDEHVRELQAIHEEDDDGKQSGDAPGPQGSGEAGSSPAPSNMPR